MKSKPPFSESFHCRSGAHCGACRDPGPAGRATRETFGRAYSLPQGMVDFDCPHGKPWGFAGPLPKAVPPAPAHGPGTELAKLLDEIGLSDRPGCACKAHMAQMNRWGPDGCEMRVEEILGWLKEEAGIQNVPFVRFAARRVVGKAIERARKLAVTP